MTKQPLTKERAFQIIQELYPDIDFYNYEDEKDGLHMLYFLEENFEKALQEGYYIINLDTFLMSEEGCICISLINADFDAFAPKTGNRYMTGEERWVLKISVEDTLEGKYDKEIQIDIKYIDEETFKVILSDYKVVTETQYKGFWRQKQIDSIIND